MTLSTYRKYIVNSLMANSRFEYVKDFERDTVLLPDTFLVVRVDGKGFHKFSEEYGFEKPNDLRALSVMNRAATNVMRDFPDILMSYGDSDEYSFLLKRKCRLFDRREMKLVSTFASFMSVNYFLEWNAEFTDRPIRGTRLPTFDARVVVYPSGNHIRDYFSWRQVDCHINNLYNTVFWKLVLEGKLSGKEAENRLIGTVSSDKNEILFKEYGINYNNELEIFKKGTVIVRDYDYSQDKENLSKRQSQRQEKVRRKAFLKELYVDIVRDDFWNNHPWILNS